MRREKKPIVLDDDRRAALLRSLETLFAAEFDEELSSFKSERVVDLMLRRLGPVVYNQAIQDARAYMFEHREDRDALWPREVNDVPS